MHWGSFAVGFIVCGGLVVLLVVYAYCSISSKCSRMEEKEVNDRKLNIEARAKRQAEWREVYLAPSRAFYESLEKQGINTCADKVVRVGEPPAIK